MRQNRGEMSWVTLAFVLMIILFGAIVANRFGLFQTKIENVGLDEARVREILEDYYNKTEIQQLLNLNETFVAGAFSRTSISTSITRLDTQIVVGYKAIRIFRSEASDIVIYNCAPQWNKLRSVIGVLGGTWYSAPANLQYATDEDRGTGTTGQSRQSADDLCYVTWSMDNAYNVLLYVRFSIYSGSSSYTAYASLKGSIDGNTWTTITTKSTTSTSEQYQDLIYLNQYYKHFRLTVYTSDTSGSTSAYLKIYEIWAYAQCQSITLPYNEVAITETPVEVFGSINTFAIKTSGSAYLTYSPLIQVIKK